MKSLGFLSAFAVGVMLAGNVHAQAKPKALPDTVMVEEGGGIVLKKLPEKLVVKDDLPYLARMGEWVAAYYACEIDSAEAGALAARLAQMFENDDWDKSGYEFAFKEFKKELRIFGFRLNDLYRLDSNSYARMVKDYNRLAKRVGKPELEIEEDSRSWSGGLRCEMEEADRDTLVKSMSPNGFKGKMATLVQREIEQGRPVPWVRMYHFWYDDEEQEAEPENAGEDAGEGKAAKKEGAAAKAPPVGEEEYGASAYVIIGLNPEKREIYYVDLARGKPAERRTMSCDEAAATTWALYKVTPPAASK